MAAPKRVELTIDEQRQLKERLKESNLSTDDQHILLGLIDFNQWLQFSLQEKKINVKRLHHAFFNKSEKSNSVKPIVTNQDASTPGDKKRSGIKTKSILHHPGRLGHSDLENGMDPAS